MSLEMELKGLDKEEIKYELWRSFDLLRGAIPISEYHFLLCLFVLYNENLLEQIESNQPEEIKKQIGIAITKLERRYNLELFSLYDFYEHIIHDCGNEIYTIILLLRSLNKSAIEEYRIEIFDDLINRFSKSQGKFGGVYDQPLELVRLIGTLVDFPYKGKIYNPFAGLASFFLNFVYRGNIISQEVNNTVWVIGVLRLITYGIENLSNFIHADSINNWNPNAEKYDLIVSTPPFRLKLDQNIQGQYGSIKTGEQFLIERGIQDLNSTGKLVMTIPNSFLSSSGTENNLRRNIVDNDLLEMVISFPAGLLMSANIPFAIIVINKEKKEKDTFRFIDATQFVASVSPKEKSILYNELDNFIKHNLDSESSKIISKSEIISNDYILTPKRYLLDVNDNIITNTITLGQVARLREKESSLSIGTRAKYIRIRDLKNDIINCFLKLDEVEYTDVPKNAFQIKYATLLLALRFDNLKPTLVNGSNEPIFVSNDIAALRVNESEIDPLYLISELNSDFVKKQVTAFSHGISIQSISKKDLLNLRVRLLSKEEQKKKVHESRDLFYRNEYKKLEELKKQHNPQAVDFTNLVSLKHSLGRPLLNVGSGVRIIESLISKSIDIKLQEELQITFKSIKQNLQLANSLLERNENELNIENYKLDEVDLVSFLKVYIETLNYSAFKSQLLVSTDITNELSGCVLINANTDLLKVLLNDILDNAERHAFKGNFNERNQLIIELQLVLDGVFPSVLLLLKNNGSPFPENFDKEKLIRKNIKAGETGNTGIGGYDIDRIAQFFKWSFDLRLNEDPIFPTSYEFSLPFQNTNNSENEDV